MIRRLIILVYLVLPAASVRAVLPPDAVAREPQMRAYRQQVRDDYEKRQIERQARAVQAYEQTRADIVTPPWLRGAKQSAVTDGSGVSGAVSAADTPKRNHRFLISVVLLILIGAGAGWVRHITKEPDR